MKTTQKECLVIKVTDVFEGEKLVEYFNMFRPTSWKDKDSDGNDIVIVNTSEDFLEWSQEAAYCLNRPVKVYGLRENGERFSVNQK